jgi:DHA1 family tetracycline resistance protein-like MFS transporter
MHGADRHDADRADRAGAAARWWAVHRLAADQAFWYGVLTFAFGLANFVGAPVLGALSDRYGRRPVLLLGFCGLALNFFVTAAGHRAVDAGGGARCSRARCRPTPRWPTPTWPTSRRRAARAPLRHAGRHVRPGLHPRAGDRRPAGRIDLHLPFFVAGTLALVNLAYGWFVLPESLPPERASRSTGSRANPLAALRGLARCGRGPAGGGDRAAGWRSSRCTPAGCCTPPSSSAGARRENGWSLFAWASCRPWCRAGCCAAAEALVTRSAGGVGMVVVGACLPAGAWPRRAG